MTRIKLNLSMGEVATLEKAGWELIGIIKDARDMPSKRFKWALTKALRLISEQRKRSIEKAKEEIEVA